VVRLGANRVMVVGLSHAGPVAVSETLAQQRTEGFGSPMFLFGKVLNALLLSPIDADIARMDFINHIVDTGIRAFGPDFLERLNAVRDRPLQKIHELVIRPSADLGQLAGEVVEGHLGDLELSPFLRFFMRAFGTGAGPRESDLLSYLLFDNDYAKPLIELGYRDAEAQEAELARFFSDEPMDQ
jgi:NTE family protein